jgi:hypothetical protein
LFSNSSPAARRRRQRKVENDGVEQQNWLPQNIVDRARKRRDVSGICQPRALKKDHLVDIKPENHRDNNGNTSVTQYSAITAVRVKNVTNMDETAKSNSNTSRQENLSATSIMPRKTAQAFVAKIPRSKTTKNQHLRAASVGNVGIDQLDKSCVEMGPIANHSKTSMLATDGKAYTDNRAVVTKISRKLTAFHSDQS